MDGEWRLCERGWMGSGGCVGGDGWMSGGCVGGDGWMSGRVGINMG